MVSTQESGDLEPHRPEDWTAVTTRSRDRVCFFWGTSSDSENHNDPGYRLPRWEELFNGGRVAPFKAQNMARIQELLEKGVGWKKISV